VNRESEVKEVQEVKEAKEKKEGVAAFFDLDGTLMAVPSLERRFFRTLRYRGAIPVRNYFFWLWEAGRLAPPGIGTILQANKMYLKGLAADRADMRGLVAIPDFFLDAIKRIAWHARQGHAIVLVSGTLEPLAEEVARALEAELAACGLFVEIRVCATRLEEEEGRWTGRIIGDAMNGEAKARALKAVALEQNLDLGSCYAYGDSADDQWMRAVVGQPVVVNPREELARLAKMHGWQVLHWKKEENVTQRQGARGEENGRVEMKFQSRETEDLEGNAGSAR
jgi:HAD superfamily hydrolase (TIGR01490 family)